MALTVLKLSKNEEKSEKIEKTYLELINLIKRDLKRDPELKKEEKNEIIRKKIIQGQQDIQSTYILDYTYTRPDILDQTY